MTLGAIGTRQCDIDKLIRKLQPSGTALTLAGMGSTSTLIYRRSTAA